MTERSDAIVIGAGHNGLTCATLLARAGLRVTVVERGAHVGGMADTREFAPGFRASGCGNFLYQVPGLFLDEMRLVSHGLTMDPRPLDTVALNSDQAPRLVGLRASDGLANPDREALEQWQTRMQRLATFVHQLGGAAPPRLHERDRPNTLALARIGLTLRRMGRDDMRELLRLIGSNIYDVLNESLNDDAVKGALALDAVLGTHMGPRSPGTMLTSLHRMGDGGGPRQPIGGLGALSDALADAAREAGVQIRLDCPVARIEVHARRASGVVLDSGEILRADQVVSGADPKTTLLQLLGARHLETGFTRRAHHLRAKGTAARLHLALKALPPAPAGRDDLLRQRMVFAPDMDFVERAFNPVKYGEASPEPVLEMALPTLADPALAPAGQHVLTITAQYAPLRPAHGWSDVERDAYQKAILGSAERALPGLSAQIIHSELLVPDDIEARFGCHGGHWHHGELALDQYFFTRPLAYAAQYATPVAGLYLCSAGSHPGGNVSGRPGQLAADAVLSARAAGGAA